jgi:broad specificity phosphatase PhoE
MMPRVFAALAVLHVLLGMTDRASAQKAVIVIRHDEQEQDHAKLAGLEDRDIPPSKARETRADALAFVLGDAGVTAIYTSEAVRTQMTARPLASKLGITPRALGADTLRHLGERNPKDVVLIVGHSDTVPRIIDALRGRPSGVELGDDEFDSLFILQRTADGSWGLIRSRY